MARRGMLWGGIIAASVAVAGLSIAAAVADATSPERVVRDYLAALASDDLATAAALAGLDAADLDRLGGMPLGDSGPADVAEIVDVVDLATGTRIVSARFGERGVDVAAVRFELEPAPFGPFTRWVLSEPPLAELAVVADRHDELVVNGMPRSAERTGGAVRVVGFIPARLEAGIASPYLDGATVRARFGTASAAGALVVEVAPSPRLQRAVEREVEAFLADCVAQRVLQPAGCPFGIAVPDRLVEPPQWRVSVPPVVSLVPGASAGEWTIEGGVTVRVALRVQRLIDGVIEERDEAVVAVVRGAVAVDDEGLTITIAPPEDEKG
ncbi:hypothetical protein [Yonghaparkia sp. Root332]|uniref:hypothetical protein n=1 Tax=Yonghaparkia sp. Root332 TaxID=1736516 RepID=UPI0006F934EE|nr:hypothetical protein [Yonghaparkia sp. Root332]KQV25878.1 hypothetical protein ASC54_02585 [Yonghaparkia sp. Root332]